MTRFMMLVAAVAVTSVTACGNTADGAKQDAKVAAEKTSEAATTAANKTSDAMSNAGASVDAAMETGKIKSALLADTRVDAGDINVDTNKDTKTVSLNGTVPTKKMRALAGDVARDKAPGFKIVNNLAIKPKA